MLISTQNIIIESKRQDYRNKLLSLVINEQWKTLKKTAISFHSDEQPLSYFKDNIWDFSAYRVGTELTKINFTYLGCEFTKTLELELKSIVLAYIYHSRHSLRVSSIIGKLNTLKRLARALENNNIYTFNGLNVDDLKFLIKNNKLNFNEIDITPINALNDLADFLPFEVKFLERITLNKLKTKQAEKSQHPVIPIRIYMAALNAYTQEVTYWHQHKEKLEAAVQTTLEYEQSQLTRMIYRLRHGLSPIGQVFNNNDAKYHKLILELKNNNIPLVDYEQSSLWDDIWEKIKPSIRTDFYTNFPSIKIGNKDFSRPADIKDFCRKLEHKCRYLILCLSGMRSNELLQITPDFGAQTITLDGIKIHIFHTKQQKITAGYQGHNDVYVTTKKGHIAYELINFLNRPIRMWLEEKGDKGWLINAFSHFQSPKPISRATNVLRSIDKLFSYHKNDFSIELTSEDIEMLRRSDPDKQYDLGDNWHITPHQLRRSLAYYLVGMELADFSQLKQQFSHYSIAMTMYYARNASSFQKMYYDLEKERLKQQSQTYFRLASKASQGVHLGGQKGKNLFHESESERGVSEDFYKKEIQVGRKHIHAVAPGMYCINHNCSMRVGIDLSECNECDWAIIENTAYAQAARVESINILEAMEHSKELSPDIVAFQITRIKAAEKIIIEFDNNFEPYEVSKNTSNYLIASTV